jgi:AraC-like DNA-binding protein
MGIQMRPIAVKALFGLPGLELKDWALDGALLFSGLNQIEDKLMAPGSFQQKARWLEDFLCQRINETADLHAAFKIKKAVEAFAANPANQNRSLLDLTGYSRSHTHRLFTDWFGLAPTHHLQLTQFTNALQSLHAPSKRLTQIAYEHGYYDQAHFIRAFKQFTNMTPKEYRKNMTGIVGQLDWR